MEPRLKVVNASPNLTVTIGKIDLAYPTLMGSGCYGSGEEFAPFADLSKLGGIVLKTNVDLERAKLIQSTLTAPPGDRLEEATGSSGAKLLSVEDKP